jgi:hypothetical protein
MSSLLKEIEEWTAGTSPALVHWLIRRCHPSDHILEVGCGRGHACLKLTPHIESLVGLEVSDPSLVSYLGQWYVALEMLYHRIGIIRAVLRRLGRILLIGKR